MIKSNERRKYGKHRSLPWYNGNDNATGDKIRKNSILPGHCMFIILLFINLKIINTVIARVEADTRY